MEEAIKGGAEYIEAAATKTYLFKNLKGLRVYTKSRRNCIKTADP